MALWKQLLLSLCVVALGLFLWVRYVPSSIPILTQLGVLDTLTQLGITPPAPAEGQPAGPPGRGGGFGGGGASRVIAAEPGVGEVNDSVTAIGTGEALRSVMVMPQVTGRLAAVMISSGQLVAEGQVLAQLEREAEAIAVERATLVLDDARVRNERVRRLQASGAASDVQIREVDLAVRQAELALRQAEFELDRRLVRAPIGGWVGIVTAEPGGQVSTNTEITRIDDRSALLVEFRLPERFVAQIAVGKAVSVRPLARDDDVTLDGRIDAIDNRVDAASRTIRVQARIDNADDALRAGMAFSITVDLAGQQFPSVDPLAIQWGREGSFVWVIRDGKAARVPVRIEQRSADVVLVAAQFTPGDQVIAEGVQRLRPGADVQPAGAGRPEGGRPEGGGREGGRPAGATRPDGSKS